MSTKTGFLKGLIFKESTEPQKTEEVIAQSATASVASSPAAQTSIKGVADTKFIDLLEGIIEQNNLPGQDYFEFKQSVENMKSIPMDEKTKFQTVYSVLSLQGCKKDVLLTSIDKYVSIIQNEKVEFETEMKQQFAKNVQAKLDQAETAKKELESLTKRLGELNTNILTFSQEAQAEEMKLNATSSNFNASADVIISAMIGDKEKINLYIA